MKRKSDNFRFGGWFSEVGVPALRRIGGTNRRHRLRWLVDFCQRTGLAQLEDQELEDAIADLAAFAVVEKAILPMMFRPSLAASDIERVAYTIRHGFNGYLSGKTWTIRTAGRNFDRNVRKGGDGPIYAVSGSIPDVVIWQAQDILAEEQIRRCPIEECGRIFIATKRQEYCGPRCSQKMRNQRFRATDPEKRSERRHQKYKGQVAKIKGSAVAGQVRTLEEIRRKRSETTGPK